MLFVSQNSLLEIVEAALQAGALGYLVKSDAAELPIAVETVVEGKQFVCVSLASNVFSVPNKDRAARITHCHEVAFYADDAAVVDGFAGFIESALKSRNAVIVVVTGLHRARLLPRLEADGVDVAAAIDQGSYISLDAADALSRLTVNDTPDPVRCRKVIGGLVMAAANCLKGEHDRVVVCGEIAPTLLSKGNAEGAIKFEQLRDEITRRYGVHTLCGYLSSAFPGKEGSQNLRKNMCRTLSRSRTRTRPIDRDKNYALHSPACAAGLAGLLTILPYHFLAFLAAVRGSEVILIESRKAQIA